MSQLFENILVFHVDYIPLELFQFTHGTLFWDALFIWEKYEQK